MIFQINNFQIHSIFHVDGSKSSTQAGKNRVHFILYLSKKLPQPSPGCYTRCSYYLKSDKFVGRKIFGGSHLGITWQLSIFQTYATIWSSLICSSVRCITVRDKTNREWGRAICNIFSYNYLLMNETL